ncbi:exported protein of unknown function [Nitrospira moscoviensis]|uniref:Uncharacterized protein n=1 Tax=Nitrospira moscoviensis TaxID=42253 RepID=A0A0K2GA56_NITMO|nr:exported protein of unknown function [Nitrospira moscoviensis]
MSLRKTTSSCATSSGCWARWCRWRPAAPSRPTTAARGRRQLLDRRAMVMDDGTLSETAGRWVTAMLRERRPASRRIRRLKPEIDSRNGPRALQ